MPKVFLSHNTKDKSTVLKVEKALKNSLVYTWIDLDEMKGG